MDKGKSIEERFWSRVEKKGPDECWNWTGMKSVLGYGYMYYKNGKRTACHRISLFLHGVEIPKGKHTDHLCRNTSCVNPAHLEVVTPQQNILRGVGIPAVNSKKEYCVNGHLLQGRNLILPKRGGRACRQCNSDWYKRNSGKVIKKSSVWREKNKERVLSWNKNYNKRRRELYKLKTPQKI